MNRRQELRHTVSVDQPVQVALVGEPGVVAVGCITDVSGHGMQLVLSESFPAGSEIKLESPDCILHGTIVYCLQQPDSPGPKRYTVGLQIEHSSWEMKEALSERRRPQRNQGEELRSDS
jgi:hypothetical protein